ncbi:MAG: hypothetical protein AVDCRST_MAG76-1765, partial [uncultured Acidimicrobiales bacterium]
GRRRDRGLRAAGARMDYGQRVGARRPQPQARRHQVRPALRAHPDAVRNRPRPGGRAVRPQRLRVRLDRPGATRPGGHLPAAQRKEHSRLLVPRADRGQAGLLVHVEPAPPPPGRPDLRRGGAGARRRLRQPRVSGGGRPCPARPGAARSPGRGDRRPTAEL